MGLAVLRRVVRVFTRPITRADVAALLRLLRLLRPRPRAAAEEPEAIAAMPPTALRRDAGPADRWRDERSGIDVSEQPLDTLPDALRDELLKAKPGDTKP
jgi:hypothetical protein